MKLFILILLNAFTARYGFVYCASCGCSAMDAVTFEKNVLDADAQCSSTKVASFDSAYQARKFAKLGISYAANVLKMMGPLTGGITTVLGCGLSIINDFMSAFMPGNSWQEALNEQYNELTRCMDAKIDAFRNELAESAWRGYMEGFRIAIWKYANGGSLTQCRNEIDALFDAMNIRIEQDFGQLPTNADYLKAEALLPTFKMVVEVYWLTFTTHLGMRRDVIGDEENNVDKLTAGDYNADLAVGQQTLQKMKAWAYKAKEVISAMYQPVAQASTVSFTDFKNSWNSYYRVTWNIYWQQNPVRHVTDSTDSCEEDTPLQSGIKKGIWESNIRAQHQSYITNIHTQFIEIIDEIARNSYLIGQYGEISYHQVTPSGSWHNCANLQSTITTDISVVKAACTANSACVGFSWTDSGSWQYLKTSNCNGLSSGADYASMWKETSPLCYEQIMFGQYPGCPSSTSGAYCHARSYEVFQQNCDADANCIGFMWASSSSWGCYRTSECTTHGRATHSAYNYYAKCSKLDVYFSSDEPLPFYHISEVTMHEYGIYFTILGLALCAFCISMYLVYICKKLGHKNGGFEALPKCALFDGNDDAN